MPKFKYLKVDREIRPKRDVLTKEERESISKYLRYKYCKDTTCTKKELLKRRIFNLVLIEPGKSFVRVIQSIGRGIRKAKDKDFVQIWDITSTCKFAKRHLTHRKKFYKEANYPFTIEKLDWT